MYWRGLFLYPEGSKNSRKDNHLPPLSLIPSLCRTHRFPHSSHSGLHKQTNSGDWMLKCKFLGDSRFYWNTYLPTWQNFPEKPVLHTQSKSWPSFWQVPPFRHGLTKQGATGVKEHRGKTNWLIHPDWDRSHIVCHQIINLTVHKNTSVGLCSYFFCSLGVGKAVYTCTRSKEDLT